MVEEDVQQVQIAVQKKAATFSQAQLDQYAKTFEGFIQSCFDRRIQALSDPELMEAETPLTRAMNNNIKLQVSLQLEEQVTSRLAIETQRMLQEESLRVKNYTNKWNQHLEKVIQDKDTERNAELEEQRKVFQTKLADEEIKVKEA